MASRAAGLHVFWVDQLDGKLTVQVHVVDAEGITLYQRHRKDLEEGDFLPATRMIASVALVELKEAYKRRA